MNDFPLMVAEDMNFNNLKIIIEADPTRLLSNANIVITEGYSTILEKAIAIYDYLIEYGERDANLTFCGDGDVCKLLKNLRG